MAEIARRSIPKDFRSIDTTTARIILVEAQDRVLASFPPENSARALRDLHELGVEVRLGSRVTEIDGDGVMIGQERVDAENIIWAAGVKASPVGAMLGVPLDRSGRVEVGPDLSLIAQGHPEVFVVGDLARVVDRRTGREVPGVAPAAMQMGRYAGRIIRDEAHALHSMDGVAWNGRGPAARPPFVYRDKGMLATIGRARAVATFAGVHFGGWVAWQLWATIHVMYLIGFRNRLIVMLQWAWQYFVFERGARLITGETDLELKGRAPRP
jgi:NADH dehydrogenase